MGCNGIYSLTQFRGWVGGSVKRFGNFVARFIVHVHCCCGNKVGC